MLEKSWQPNAKRGPLTYIALRSQGVIWCFVVVDSAILSPNYSAPGPSKLICLSGCQSLSYASDPSTQLTSSPAQPHQQLGNLASCTCPALPAKVNVKLACLSVSSQKIRCPIDEEFIGHQSLPAVNNNPTTSRLFQRRSGEAHQITDSLEPRREDGAGQAQPRPPQPRTHFLFLQ
jgi:hypothetical protein